MIEPTLARLDVELVDKVGLLRWDLRREHDLEKCEGRKARVAHKMSALAERVSEDNSDLAKAIRTACPQLHPTK